MKPYIAATSLLKTPLYKDHVAGLNHCCTQYMALVINKAASHLFVMVALLMSVLSYDMHY